ncbi:MAG: NAD(P)H-hydrate dehydratase [Candidatus Krumholzibacteriota bacterium]|nr:NAD(P)H-hydrate dehydratase [Candidatus Krumholzibacteriota bacterium]
MHVVTAEEMRRLDEATISRHVPGLTLMERAGQGVVDAIGEFFDPPGDFRYAILLGSGNNAGDGLVVARLLAETGARVVLLYLREPKDLSPDAFKNYARLRKDRKQGRLEEIFLYLADWEGKMLAALDECDVVVDAIFGTGLGKPVTGRWAEAIELVRRSRLPVVAIDVPSGIDGTTGAVLGTAIRADLTVTMGLPKTGLLFYPGKEHVGGLRVVDIGIPAPVVEEARLSLGLLDLDQAVADLPPRDPAGHKFDRGALLLVAGSRRYAGAAVLAAGAALRTGCGIVYLAGPESIRQVVQVSAPEIIFVPLAETVNGSIDADPAALLDEVRFDAVACGPGLTADAAAVRFVGELAGRCNAPLLLDADGINAFAGAYDRVKALSADRPIVLTPHAGELARLTGADVGTDSAARIEALRLLVAGTGIVLACKGAPTVVVEPDGAGYVNWFGHPGQATAGSGDVLAGAIGGFLAQGASPAAATRLGVFVHSRAADIASADTGERAMLAGDCMDAMPLAMLEVEEETL